MDLCENLRQSDQYFCSYKPWNKANSLVGLPGMSVLQERRPIGLQHTSDQLLTILILTLASVLFLTLSVIFSVALFLPDRCGTRAFRRVPGTSQGNGGGLAVSTGALERLQDTVQRCRNRCCVTDDGGQMLVVVDCDDDPAADDAVKVASDDDDDDDDDSV